MASKGFEPTVNFDEQEGKLHLWFRKKKSIFYRHFLRFFQHFYFYSSKLTRNCILSIEWKILGKESHNQQEKNEKWNENFSILFLYWSVKFLAPQKIIFHLKLCCRSNTDKTNRTDPDSFITESLVFRILIINFFIC